MKLEICLGQILGLTFSFLFCFCWFAVLRALFNYMLLWLNFTLPSTFLGKAFFTKDGHVTQVGKTVGLKIWLNIL